MSDLDFTRDHLWLSSSAAALYFNYEEISVLYCVSIYKKFFGIDTIEILFLTLRS